MQRLLCRYLVFPLTIITVVTSLAVLETGSAFAGLWVTGASLAAEVSPGDTLTHNFSVGIRETDPPMDIQIDVGGMGQSLNGTCQALDSSRDTNAYSARQFITLDKSSFHLDPGNSQKVVATIHVPRDTGAGGRYAVINVHSQPVSEGQVNMISAINIPIYLTIKGSQLIYAGRVTEISTSEPADGQPVHIFTVFQNTGNHHFKVKGEVTIADAQGQILDSMHLASTSSAIIPTMSRLIESTFIPQSQLPSGVYSIKSRLMLEDGTVVAETSGNFAIEEIYIPPQAPASVTLTPNKTSVLKTENGEISVIFPAGAVAGQVAVSLRNYPVEQIPPPPKGFEMASTVFRIDGLSGILDKGAAVTVKYTQADLNKAGGDASRLRLARWDEAQNRWQFLPTQVDTLATSLSTDSKQLSIWAIMVAPHSGGINWWPIIGPVAGIAIIGVLAYNFVARRIGRS